MNSTKDNKPRLLIIQPILTSYRVPVFLDISENFSVTLISSEVKSSSGFANISSDENSLDCVQTPEKSVAGKVFYQCGIIKIINKKKPNAIFSFANPRYISFWLTLFYAKINRIPFFAHGQGLFKKRGKPNIISIMMFKIICGLSTKYICYNDIVCASLTRVGISDKKLAVAPNTLINANVVTPTEKSGNERGILFLGRLRKDNRLDDLVDALNAIQNEGERPTLHVVGDGPDSDRLKNKYGDHKSVIFYGKQYESSVISNISRNCLIGCYPGGAGLSVVHYFSLSLPVVVHDAISEHMGPEPSYVIPFVNGLTFPFGSSSKGLAECFNIIFNDKSLTKEMSYNAYLTYQDLNAPGMGKKISSIISDNI